ncbi:homeobox protein HAZ1 isoform X1 [Aegilops tauschii subsp. strangulata]
MDKSNTSGCAEDTIETRSYANSSLNPEALKHQSFPFPYTSLSGERKNFKRAANRGRKGSRVLSSRTYPLKSSESTVRVLRSRSVADKSPSDAVQTPTERAAKKPPSDSVDTLVKPAAKRIKRDRPTKGGPDDELSKIRKRIRYILNRMNYHQSFLEAYASEGWKNQSLEKIRPEKELERAKVEIVRCKLRIREAFQNLDHLLTVGKLEESLFDSEGKISSDDIVCATCSLQEATLNNDIILCDGACDRGFHQNCLNPPLLTKDIPEGEEGWLCPACDCKIDCIELINELQGTDLDINDSWEKVFPEASAVAHGPMQNDVADLPSDDSEDDDFDPNISEEHVAGHAEGSSEEDGDEGSDSDDSNFMTSSDNSEHVKEKVKVDDLGLPSEDSEDDDYDPAGPDSDKDIEEKQDESDFTSDSDEFCAEITKSCSKDEVSSGPKVGGRTNDLEGAPVRPNTSMSHSKDLEIDPDVILPSTKRQVQRLDYKKLYDDTYGEAPSESSDGDEWSGKSTLKEENEERNEVDSFARKSSRGTREVHPDGFHGLVNDQHAGGLTSDGSNSKAKKRHFGPVINERLNQYFTTDQYPSRAVKESLAQELGLTFRQVNKWFESTRHARAAAMKNGSQLEKQSNSRKKKSSDATHMEVKDQPNACKEEGIRQHSPVKQDTDGGQRTHVPPESSQSYTKTPGLVGCPKSESRENHEKNTSSKYVGMSTDGSAEDQILGLEPEDEGSDSDDLNFVTRSGNSEPLKNREKVDDLGLPSAYSEDDDYDSDEVIEMMQSSSDESNFTTSSDNPEDVKEKVDGLGLPSEDSEDDDYDPAGPGSDEDIGKKQSSSEKSHSSDKSENRKTKRKVDDLGLPSEDSEDDDYDPASPDSDKDIEEKQDESDFSSDSDDFCVEIAKSCSGQEGVPSGAKVGGDRTDDLEGTTICANAAISNLPSKDPEMDQYVVLPVSARQKVQSPDSKKLAQAYGKAPSDSSYSEELSKKGTPEKDNGKESEAGSFMRQINEFTPQRSQQSFHGSVNGQNAEELLTPNGSSTTGQKRQYGPIINQRLHEQFKSDQYPSRAVKESLAQELGLTFRQVEKWFESRRRHIRVASKKSSTHVENHSTKENPNVCKSDAVNEDTPSGILNEGITQDGPLKQDIGGGLRTNASPPNSSQRYTTPLVRRPKGESRENHMKNTSSSSASSPKGSDAGYAVLALEALDEKTRSKMLQELKKRKIG